MKKLLLLLLANMFAIAVTNSQTTVKFGIAGDSYWATDNDASVGLNPRKLSNSNIYKDRFGINNVLLDASVLNDNWKAKLSLANFGTDKIVPEDANISLKLFDNLWINGGLYATWDLDYTFNDWFTENSLVDLRGMAAPSLGWGLSYNFKKEDMTLGIGMLNSGVLGGFIDNNLSKSLYVKFDWNKFYKDWNITFFGISGKETAMLNNNNNLKWNDRYIFFKASGTIIEKLEGQLQLKMFSMDDDNENAEVKIAGGAQILVRYCFNEKFKAGARFSFVNDKKQLMFINNSGFDIGLVCEYNPTSFTYLRLEGAMVSLSNSNETAAKIFTNRTEAISSRLGLAVSMGFKFDLFEREF